MSEDRSDVAARGSVVGGMRVLPRISGLVRDVVLAHILGVGVAAGVFFLARRIPSFLRWSFAEGAFSQAFVPCSLNTGAASQSESHRCGLCTRLGCR